MKRSKNSPTNVDLLLLRAQIRYSLATSANQKLAGANKDSKEAQQQEANRTKALKALLEDSETIIKLDGQDGRCLFLAWMG
jgi:hypothetical protein